MARHELADQVAVLLQRAHPGELSKEELIDAAGLSDGDLRACLLSLTENNELDQSAEGYRWNDPNASEPVPTPDTDAPEDEQPAVAPERIALAEHSGRHSRVVLEVVGTFSPGRGQSDDATLEQGQAIAEQVQNVLGTAMAGVGALVTVKRLEAFDKPRVLFDAEQHEEGAEPDSE